jgi:hypothetical protein
MVVVVVVVTFVGVVLVFGVGIFSIVLVGDQVVVLCRRLSCRNRRCPYR